VPGATERLGIGSADLRQRYPQLITCDISGYGDGAYGHMKAYDFLVQSESGLVGVSGGENEVGRIGVSICDIGTGMNAFGGILQALFLRERTGVGSSIQVSLFDTAAEWMQVPLAHYEFGGKAPRPMGLNHPSIAPYGGYQTKDGTTVVISIQNNQEWASFATKILRRPDMVNDPLFASNEARVANRPKMNIVIDSVFGSYHRAELLRQLREAAIAYGSVNSVADLAQHPALRRLDMLVNDQIASLIAPPVIMDGQDKMYASVPALGEHTEKVRQEFGDG
jgi:crotonobetainyl-CoA:carnitine CoA-transferase CaiB-like acyl-CoA transferase